jgi:hypothetical protein
MAARRSRVLDAFCPRPCWLTRATVATLKRFHLLEPTKRQSLLNSSMATSSSLRARPPHAVPMESLPMGVSSVTAQRLDTGAVPKRTGGWRATERGRRSVGRNGSAPLREWRRRVRSRPALLSGRGRWRELVRRPRPSPSRLMQRCPYFACRRSRTARQPGRLSRVAITPAQKSR